MKFEEMEPVQPYLNQKVICHLLPMKDGDLHVTVEKIWTVTMRMCVGELLTRTFTYGNLYAQWPCRSLSVGDVVQIEQPVCPIEGATMIRYFLCLPTGWSEIGVDTLQMMKSMPYGKRMDLVQIQKPL